MNRFEILAWIIVGIMGLFCIFAFADLPHFIGFMGAVPLLGMISLIFNKKGEQKKEPHPEGKQKLRVVSDEKYLLAHQCEAWEWRKERAKRYKVDYVV